jgi:hypothetical protein
MAIQLLRAALNQPLHGTMRKLFVTGSVAHRIALWRRVYETLAELASRIDADTQGKIITAVHSRIPIVTPNEQRACV